ncbi:hypothetical protein BDZ85DRAFT_73701 [Elsinoe ampelina]|uniref:Uncharacterized protein n=1 Tax=Elsinoe ampelina TaxID=302913 RepID=A0A6A6GJQ0_9PEZI|nr:hypothetical protein BDZ85DRAFT_73701 [Elsinoe ampelina]
MENVQQQQRSPLDQMQFIFNKALECTASVFQAANHGGNREKAAATALRLKQMIPAANVQFHDALDELEAEIMQARFILKQELSALRTKQADTSTNGTNGTHQPEPSDVDMPDVPPQPDEVILSSETNQDRTLGNGHVQNEPVKPDEPKANLNLQIDTSSKPDGSEAAELTTGGMSTMDFDSLFNDPNSASASITGSPPKLQMTEPPKSEPSAPAPPAQMQAQDNNEDLSSLLPGLESYANAADDTIDLSTPAPDPKKPEPPSTQPQNQTQTQTQTTATNPPSNSGGSQGDQRDTTFDDLMNFADFDLGSFGGGDGDFDGSGTTFDESFFNVE